MNNLAGKNYLLERKSSAFGTVGVWDRGNELERQAVSSNPMSYYDNMKRKEIYETALNLYTHDQLARPIVNMIVNATFSEAPDFQGDEELVKRADQIIQNSEIDWSTWGTDLEVHGDVLLRSFVGKNPKIASIPANSIDIDYDEKNIIDIRWYLQYVDEMGKGKRIDPEQMTHIKINNTSNMIWGASTLRGAFWWLDVLDNLWERNWIRGGQYYGSPVVVIAGVPGEAQAKVKTSLEANAMRPGRNIILPPDCTADTLDFTKNYPIQDLIDRIYQYILAACGVPQHLVYETDSSRGVAMFSGDGFNMMIKNRQRTWSLGLTRAMKYIFEDEGLWNEDSKFYVRWAPVFLRDLKNFSAMMQVGIENGVLSKQTARELIGVDHSEELLRMKQMEKDEPIPEPVLPAQGVSGKMAPTPKAKVGKPKTPPPRR